MIVPRNIDVTTTGMGVTGGVNRKLSVLTSVTTPFPFLLRLLLVLPIFLRKELV